jgi:hypothetical protein
MAEERGQISTGGAQGEEDKYSSVLRGANPQAKKPTSARGSGGEKKRGTSPVVRAASPVKAVSIFDTVDTGNWADEVDEEVGPTASAPPPKNAWGVKPVFKNPPAAAPIVSAPTASSSSGVKVSLCS